MPDGTESRWSSHGIGRLVTRRVAAFAEGRQLLATSRRHRKGLAPEVVEDAQLSAAHRTRRRAWLRWWAPARISWWIAVLFIVGSGLFTLGGFAVTWTDLAPAPLRETGTVNVVFFVGSVFFTSAAALQMLEAINGDVNEIERCPRSWRWFGWRPKNAGYLASLIQLVGTILFNFNTADALIQGLGRVEEEVLVWTPDVLGCGCFLVASYLAFLEATHGSWKLEPRSATWWIVSINLVGSVAFGVSAATGYPGSDSDAPRFFVANLGTFLGAVCFLAASYLLLPEMFDGEERGEPSPGANR